MEIKDIITRLQQEGYSNSTITVIVRALLSGYSVENLISKEWDSDTVMQIFIAMQYNKEDSLINILRDYPDLDLESIKQIRLALCDDINVLDYILLCKTSEDFAMCREIALAHQEEVFFSGITNELIKVIHNGVLHQVPMIRVLNKTKDLKKIMSYIKAYQNGIDLSSFIELCDLSILKAVYNAIRLGAPVNETMLAECDSLETAKSLSLLFTLSKNTPKYANDINIGIYQCIHQLIDTETLDYSGLNKLRAFNENHWDALDGEPLKSFSIIENSLADVPSFSASY